MINETSPNVWRLTAIGELLGDQPWSSQAPSPRKPSAGTRTSTIIAVDFPVERSGAEAAVPGPREEAGTTGPRAETPAPVKADATLTKLQATRDALTNKVRTPAEERKLNTLNQQIAKREAALEKARAPEPLQDQALAEDRRGGVKQPFQGPPKVGREPDFLDYKFNDGTSVYRDVFREAGYNPDTATSLPIEKQVQILSRHMEKKFGFSSVEVVGARGEARQPGRQKTSRDAMLDMTRATHDLMAVLGLPPEAASDHGNLRLVIEPTGKANYYGAYEHSGVIHVMGGANSFGHEWIHAIDHLLAERFTNNPRDMNKLLTQYGRDSGLDVTDNVQAAMAKLINTMFYEDAALAARHLALTVDAAKTDKAGNPTKKALAAQDQLELLEAGGSKLRIHASDFPRKPRPQTGRRLLPQRLRDAGAGGRSLYVRQGAGQRGRPARLRDAGRSLQQYGRPPAADGLPESRTSAPRSSRRSTICSKRCKPRASSIRRQAAGDGLELQHLRPALLVDHRARGSQRRDDRAARARQSRDQLLQQFHRAPARRTASSPTPTGRRRCRDNAGPTGPRISAGRRSTPTAR